MHKQQFHRILVSEFPMTLMNRRRWVVRPWCSPSSDPCWFRSWYSLHAKQFGSNNAVLIIFFSRLFVITITVVEMKQYKWKASSFWVWINTNILISDFLDCGENFCSFRLFSYFSFFLNRSRCRVWICIRKFYKDF